jgi:hypothetical protein
LRPLDLVTVFTPCLEALGFDPAIGTLGDEPDRALLLGWVDDLGLERPWSAVNHGR